MAEELFNGTLQTTIAGDERIAFGKPGEIGSKNISFANLAAAVSGTTPEKATFQNVDLNSGDNYSLTINHGKNTLYVGIALYDNNSIQQATNGIFEIIDSNNVKLTMNAPIAGQWRYALQFL